MAAGAGSESPGESARRPDASPVAGDPQTLVDWLRWLLRTMVGLGVFFLALFALLRSPASLIIGASLLGVLAPTVLYGVRAAQRGRVTRGIATACATTWLLALLVATRGSVTLVLAIALILLPVIVALPNLSRRALLRLALGATAVAVSCAAIAAAGPLLPSTLSERALAILAVPLTLIVVGLSLAALWHVGSRLRESLTETQATNRALIESERGLEQKVEERTAEIAARKSEAEDALAESASLHEIARTANSTLDIDRVAETVMEALQRVFSFDMMGIGLVDERREVLDLRNPVGPGFPPGAVEALSQLSVRLSEEDSAFAHVARTGQPFLLKSITPEIEAAMSASDRRLQDAFQAHSLLICPLEIEDQTVGVIAFANSQGTIGLERGDVGTVRRYLTHLSIAIRNARLLDEARAARAEALERSRELERALAEVEDIDEIARTANATLDVGRVVDVALGAIQKIFPSDLTGVGLLDERREFLDLDYPRGEGWTAEGVEAVSSLRVPMSEEGSALAHVARTNRPFAVGEVGPETEAAMSRSDRVVFENSRPRSFLICPLEVEGEPIGFIIFANSREAIGLEPSDVERIRRYIRPLATAIRNARLFEEAKAALAETSEMHEIVQTTNATLDLDRVATRVMEALQKIFHFDQLAIGLFDAERSHLVLEYMRGAGFEGGIREKIAGLMIPADEQGNAFVAAVRRRQPVYVPRMSPELAQSPSDRVFYEANPPQALLICPLEIEGEAIGVIYFGHTRQPFDLDEAEIETIRRYVTLLSTAIRNARLFEEAEAARGAAVEANQAKSQFLANMSHELRTPLTAIIGYAEMLTEEVGDELADHREDLEQIQSSGNYLLELINGVLDLSKVEAGKMDVYVEHCDVGELVNGVADTVRPLVEQNSNRLIVGDFAGLGAMRTDVTKLRQTLLNLLSNATKFTEEGEIRLEAERATRDKGDWLQFRVADSGIGMSDEQSSRVFEAFAQADATTTRKYGGTGLGLAITKQFCEMLGGSIEVESALGQGTTFTVRLPAETQLERRPNGTATTDAGGEPGAKTVLIVDDDPAARDLISRILAPQGVRVVTAAGGRQAMELARERRPDVITLDVVMPEMDGWAVLGELKADPELADIPVVVVSITEERNLGHALGAAEYLTKPIDSKRLAAVLEKYGGDGPGRAALVVDDDPRIRQMLRRGLERAGWSVMEAENGRVALSRVNETTPDLLLLDLMMPEMDGFELLETLREREAWREIPVVVVSAKDLTPEDRARLNGGVARVVEKRSWSPRELVDQVLGVVGREGRGS